MYCRRPTKTNTSIRTRCYANDAQARKALFRPTIGTHPLTEALEGVPAQIDGALKSASLKTSALPNGLRIATLSSNSPVASVGIFIDAGSRYETRENAGVTYFLQKFLTSETFEVESPLRLTRVIEGMNANYLSSAAREQIYYGGELPAEHADDFATVLFDVTAPLIHEYEVIEKRDQIEREVHEIESNPKLLINELVHQEAYKHQGLGRSLHTPLYNLNYITDADIKHFVGRTFQPNRMVLVGIGGVDHERFVKIAADTWGELPPVQGLTKPSSPYIGGADLRISGNHETHLALAFQGAGLGAGKDFFSLGVLQHMLGGGRTFFKEGLGRASSRLNRALEKNANTIDEVNSFNFSYSDSGLFGVYGVSHPGHASQLAKVLTSTLSGVKNVEKDEVDRARQQFKATVLQNVERRLPLLEFIGTHVISTGKVVTPEEFVRNIESVTVDDVRSAAKKVLASKPTLVALGDVTGLPLLDDLRASLQ